MIGLSMATQSTASYAAVVIREKPSSNLRNETARVSRFATLDGGCVIDHQGFSDGDRTFEVAAVLEQSECDVLWNLFTEQTFVNIATRDGFFYGVIESMNDESGAVKLKILVKE